MAINTRALAIGGCLLVVGGVVVVAATYKSPTDQILERLKSTEPSVSSYCQVLEEQHRQHRNASGAMGKELDAQTAGHNFNYESNTVALSDAMYASLKRDNNCP